MPMPPTSITAESGARAATGPLTKAIMRCGLSVRCGCRMRCRAGRLRCGATPPVLAATACWRRSGRGPRQMWQMASARASAASAGLGGASSRSSRVTIAPTWALSARPLPVTAALTSLGVCRATGMPRRAAHSMATALAWAVPITVRTLCWLNTRSTATNSGRCSSSHCSMPCSIGDQPQAQLGVGRGAYDADADHRQRAARRRPRPRRHRTGSVPGPRPVRAPRPSPLVRLVGACSTVIFDCRRGYPAAH